LLTLLVLLGVAVAAHGSLGCKGQEATTVADTTGSAAPIDTETMAFLSAARSLHHVADLKEEAHDLPGAIEAMTRLVRLPIPHPGMRVVEVEEVLADAYARMAELKLRNGDVDGAARDVESGLEHVQEPTYFRGHLLEVEGIVEKTRAAQLADAGQTAQAEQARERANQLFYESVRVQEQVIEKTLPADGGNK
jgi:hypothetical protein